MSNEGDRPFVTVKTTPITATELDEIRALKRRALQQHTSLLVYHRDGVRVVPLFEGQRVVIGRSAPADVPIRDSSLSRQHACVEVLDGQVWIEDLGSTNGTWIDGERVDRSPITSSSSLELGALPAALVSAESSEAVGPCCHDAFIRELDRETARARAFEREAALLMVRCAEGHPSRWMSSVQPLLRPFDTVGLYSPNTIEVLLPEASVAQGRQLVEAIIVGSSRPLRCGLAQLPEHAGSAGELLEVALRALQAASESEPWRCAPRPADSVPRPAEDCELVVCSEAMQKVFATVDKLASSSIPVLILGETGTGKEVVATAIHDGGKRAGNPLVCVNCGAIPGQLVESTLFGHEKGAFTGASQQAKGVFETADGGTVLLDEIGELPPSTQVALLRVLETKRICRVGSNKEIAVDVRVLAATHRDLKAMCDSGEFREDLLYRLNAMTLQVPPLRDRPEEISALADHFVAQANKANDRQIKQIDEAARQRLLAYRWPGNVRELRNVVERAVVIANDELITVDDLPEQLRAIHAPEPAEEDSRPPPPEPAAEETAEEINLQQELRNYEADLILRALRAAGWDRKTAARQLGIPLRTLARRMSDYNIKRLSYNRE